MNEGTTLSFDKNISVFISLERGQGFCGLKVRHTDGEKGRRILTVILTHNFLAAL